MLRWTSGSICALAFVLLSGCGSTMQESATIPSNYLTTAPSAKRALTGLPYYLPRTVVPIKVTGDFQVIPASAKKKENELTPTDYEYAITVEVQAAKQLPDPGALALLQYNGEPGSADEFRLNVTANGLLSTVKSTATDRSGEVILKLVELGKTAATLPIAFFSKINALDKAVPTQTPDERRAACFALLRKFTLEEVIDASNLDRQAVKLADVNKQILEAMKKDSRTPYEIKTGEARPLATLAVTPSTGASEPPKLNAAAVERGNDSGVVFRIMEPRELALSLVTTDIEFRPAAAHADKDICRLTGEKIQRAGIPLLAANPQRTFVVDTSRTMLVKKRVDLLVSDGVLTGVEVDKPSELLELVSLPVNILKAIAAIPGELLSVKVKNIEDEKKLTAAEVELLKAQIELLKQKQALEDARKAQEQKPGN